MNKSGSPVVRFEIGCEQSEKTKKFYENVFGWSTIPAPYTHHVNTNNEKGISGALTSLGHPPHQYVMVYIEVEQVSQAIKEIELNGGKNHIGPLPTGSNQFFAWVHDPEGNLIGLLSDRE